MYADTTYNGKLVIEIDKNDKPTFDDVAKSGYVQSTLDYIAKRVLDCDCGITQVQPSLPLGLGCELACYVLYNEHLHRHYRITKNIVDKLDSNVTVIIEPDEGLLPAIPTYHNYYGRNAYGQRGTVFVLDEMPSDEVLEALNNEGCTLISTTARYAPELTYAALFVPNGANVVLA